MEPEHVLHVEDDDTDADILAHLLKSSPYRLSRVRTYGEMLEFQGRPDVVLLDLRIPGSDDPIRLVHDTVRRFPTSGILLLTGIGDRDGEELGVRAMAAGAQGRLLKGTFDKRRLRLSISEAYQQRQHLLRMIDESRADMRVDPDSIREVMRSVMLEEDFARGIKKVDDRLRQALSKLRKLGAEDTEPHDSVPPKIDPKRLTPADVLSFVKKHEKLLKWILGAVVAGYFALGDYVNGIREAVYETRDIAKKIEKKIDG